MDGKDYPIILLGIVVLVITIIFNLVIVVPLIYVFTGEKKEKIEHYKKENEDSE